MAIAMQQLTELPPSLRAKGVVIPLEAEEVILKALEKDPQQRFPDILAFATALEQASQPAEKSPSKTSFATTIRNAQAVSPQSNTTASPSVEKKVSVLTHSASISELLEQEDGRAGTLLATYRTETDDEIRTLAWSPDGKMLAVGSSNKTTIWETGSEKLLFEDRGETYSLAWSFDGRYLVTGDRHPFIYNLPQQQKVALNTEQLRRDSGFSKGDPIWYTDTKSFAWLPDNRHFVSLIGKGEFVVLWDATNGKPQRIYNVEDSTGPGDCIAVSPDGKYFVVSADSASRVWSIETGKMLRSYREPDTTTLLTIAWSPDGKYFATYGSSKVGHVWEVATGACVSTWQSHKPHWTENSMVWSPDGKYLAFAGGNANVYVWEALTGQEVYVYRGHNREIIAVAWSPDGSRIASGSGEEGEVHTWVAPNSRNVHAYRPPAEDDIFSFPIHDELADREGRKLLSATQPTLVLAGCLRSNQKTGTRLATCHLEESSSLEDLAWSPNGNFLAAAGSKSMTIWDTTDMAMKKQIAYGSGWSYSVAWSPDSTCLVTGCQSPFVYNVLSNQGKIALRVGKLERYLPQRQTTPDRFAWLPSNRRFLLSTMSEGEDSVVLWDAFTGDPFRIYKVERRGPCDCIAVSPDGKYFVILADTAAQVWSIETGKMLRSYHAPDTSTLLAVAWSPNGKYFATYGYDKVGHVWEVATGACVSTWQSHKPHWTENSMVWSPNGKYLAFAGGDTNVYVWEALTGREIYVYREHTKEASAVAWSPDGSCIASGSGEEMNVHIWQAPQPQQIASLPVSQPEREAPLPVSEEKLIKAYREVQHGQMTDPVSIETLADTFEQIAQDPQASAAYSFDAGRAASNLRAQAEQMRKVEPPFQSRLQRRETSPQGPLPVGRSAIPIPPLVPAHTVRPAPFELRELASMPMGKLPIFALAWSPESKWYLAVGVGMRVYILDISAGKFIHQLEGHGHMVWSLAWSPNGSHLASASTDKTIRIWDAKRGKLLKTCTGHTATVWSVDWSPDGRSLVSGSEDKTVRIWDVKKGKLLRTYTGHAEQVRAVAWSPNGSRFASASDDQAIWIWDAHAGKPSRVCSGHTDEVKSVVWSPDGNYFASAGNDRTVRLWETSTGRTLHICEGHTGSVDCITWSPDGRYLASASSDETIRIWEVATGQTIHVCQDKAWVRSVAWSSIDILASSTNELCIRNASPR